MIFICILWTNSNVSSYQNVPVSTEGNGEADVEAEGATADIEDKEIGTSADVIVEVLALIKLE